MSDILIKFVLPVLTALIAWLGTAYRNKQKKEGDVLDNVKRILDIQNDQIKRQDNIISRYEKKIDAMENKSAHDRESIKQAYTCKHPSEECPVLKFDAMWIDTECKGDCSLCSHGNCHDMHPNAHA